MSVRSLFGFLESLFQSLTRLAQCSQYGFTVQEATLQCISSILPSTPKYFTSPFPHEPSTHVIPKPQCVGFNAKLAQLQVALQVLYAPGMMTEGKGTSSALGTCRTAVPARIVLLPHTVTQKMEWYDLSTHSDPAKRGPSHVMRLPSRFRLLRLAIRSKPQHR